MDVRRGPLLNNYIPKDFIVGDVDDWFARSSRLDLSWNR
jgi:hypothetical protein